MNLLWLVPGVVGGSEEHTTRLLRALAPLVSQSGDFELVLFVNSSFVNAYPDLVAEFETVTAPVDGSNKALRVGVEATWLARAAVTHGIDLMHHAGGTMPAVRTRPGIISIHDLQPLVFPEYFGRVKRAYLGFAIPRSARRARRVVTLSDWVRDDVTRRLGIPSERIAVVSPGAELAASRLSPEKESEILARYEVAGSPYFLYPAITYEHKNHKVLIEALAVVLASHPDVVLVLTGGQGPFEGALRTAVAVAGVTGSVRRPGRIPEDHLGVLYDNAVALAFPSLYEGFGMPVLEAMARGCPVIAARSTALPEVLGDAGALVDPSDPDAWAQAMIRLLDDQPWRERLREAGVERASDFDWQRSAGTLQSVYASELS